MDLSRFFPPSLLDQSFGLCISPDDIIFPSYNLHRTNYYRPWKWYMQQAEKDFGSTIEDEKEKFNIALDVQHFQPNEINVKVADREIIIEGKHEDRQDNHGFISRQFKRRYFLPPDCDVDSVLSSLSSDGVLTVTANKMKQLKNKEITVPIKMCESCPKKDLNTKTEKKEQTINANKKADSGACKKNMEVMLKEDHCCLLKPELLGALTSSEKIDTKKEAILTEKCEQADIKTSGKAANQKDIGASGQTSTGMTEKSLASSLTTAAMSEKLTSEATIAEKMQETASVACGLASVEKIATAACGMSSVEKFETELCDMSSIGKGETLLCGISSAGKSEQVEAVACGITSEVLTEKAATSTATTSEMCKMKSMVSETIEIAESSSYSSSMASSIKETTEKISEIVSDISAQLKEAAENI